jgi:hypothetical protein
MRLYRADFAERGACDELELRTGQRMHRQGFSCVMHESWICLFVCFGQRHPRLNAVNLAAVFPHRFEAFGMTDAAARSHPVDLARSNHLIAANAVAVDDLAREQIRDRG